jgi:hypothetical protein
MRCTIDGVAFDRRKITRALWFLIDGGAVSATTGGAEGRRLLLLRHGPRAVAVCQMTNAPQGEDPGPALLTMEAT